MLHGYHFDGVRVRVFGDDNNLHSTMIGNESPPVLETTLIRRTYIVHAAPGITKSVECAVEMWCGWMGCDEILPWRLDTSSFPSFASTTLAFSLRGYEAPHTYAR